MIQTDVVNRLNEKYNKDGIFFTEDKWENGSFINLQNERVNFRYRNIGFPFKEHEKNYEEGMTVPLNEDGDGNKIEELFKANMDWIVPLVTHLT